MLLHRDARRLQPPEPDREKLAMNANAPHGTAGGCHLHVLSGGRRRRIEVLSDGFDGPGFRGSRGPLLQGQFRAERRHGRVPEGRDAQRRRRAQAQREAALSPAKRKPAASAPKSGKRPSCACPTMKASGTALPSNSPILSRSDDHRYLIAQWKREIDPGAEGDFSPFLALRMRQGKLFATVETNYLPPVGNDGKSGPAGCQADAGLAATGNQPDARAGRHRRDLDAGGRASFSGLHRRDQASRTTATSCPPPTPAGSTSQSTQSQVRMAPAVSSSSPTASRS